MFYILLAVAGVSGASGFIMSGTQSVTSQYMQTGDWSKTDWLSIGKEALIGGTEGFVTGYIGAGIGTALTNALGKTALAGSLLNSTSTVTRVASHAAIGSISQIGAGVTTRFAGSMLTNGFDVEKSTKAAFDLQGILMDGAIGGVFGGIQGVKQPQVSPQVQEVNGVGEGASVTNKSGVKSVDSVIQSGVGGVSKSGTKTIITPEIEEKILRGQRKNPAKNELIGGHSPNIDNANLNYSVEIININPDGTKKVKFVTQYPDGNLSNIKTSTLFPDSWSNEQIMNSIKTIGNTAPIGARTSDRATLYRGVVNGVQVEVIKAGDIVISAYPTGGMKTGLLPGFSDIQ